ncbi:hypothetical protein [uncultured Mediterranean phage uvMED]|nr:hypothetical protein [uncultured Mediterranean phage uvMED]
MIIKAILEIKSDAQVNVHGSDIDTARIEWVDDNPTNITLEQIKTKISEIEKRDAHIRPRRKSYPSIVNQLDYIYHHGITKWKTDLIKPIKDANPKENE